MRGITILAIAVAILSTSIDALTLQRRTDGPPRVVGLPIQRKAVSNPLARDRLRRRSGSVDVSLDNEETLYFANVSLGTPTQMLRLHIDTGSSDMWVNTPKSTECESRGNQCSLTGTYNANSSSTYSYLSSDFNISYVDGSGASGDYAADTLTIGGTTLAGQQFGIGYVSSSAEGILGVGYQSNEVLVGRLRESPYDNVPAKMVTDKVIASNAYSLWLNDLEASTGSILFGGVDTEQFHGTLATLPIQPVNGQFTEFLITLTAVSLGGSTIADQQNVAALLDSGTSLSYVPNAMAAAIYEAVGAQYDASQGTAFIPCAMAQNTSATIDFTFTSPTISVTMDELVLDLGSATGQPEFFSDGQQACIFGIAPSGSSGAILGDTFLRSAYVVYDLANNQISLAQTNFNATGMSGGGTVTGSSAASESSATGGATMMIAPMGAVVAIGAAVVFAAFS